MNHSDSEKLLQRQEVEARFGRLVRYRVKDIEAWIEQNTTRGAQ